MLELPEQSWPLKVPCQFAELRLDTKGAKKQNTAEPSPEIATEDLALQTEGIGALRHRDDIKLLGRNAT